MAAALPAIMIASTVAGAGMSIYSGFQANNAAKREAGLQEDQARTAREEADREAQLHAEDVRKFSRNQALAFLKNGVSLSGSPLLALDYTLTRGQEEVNSIVKSGDAQANLYNQRAAQTKNSGRAALIGGFTQAAGTIAAGAGMASKAGLFNSSPSMSETDLFTSDMTGW